MMNLKFKVYEGNEYDDFIISLNQPTFDVVVVANYFDTPILKDKFCAESFHLPYRYENKNVLIIYPQYVDYSFKDFLNVAYYYFNPSYDDRFSYVVTTMENDYYKNYKEDEVIEVIAHGGFNRTYYITHKIEDLYDLDLRELDDEDERSIMGRNIVQLKNKIAIFNSEKGSYKRLVHQYQSTLKPLEQLVKAMRSDLIKIDGFFSSNFKKGDIVRWGKQIYLVNEIIRFNAITDEFDKIISNRHESLTSPIKMKKDYSSFYIRAREVLKSGKISTRGFVSLFNISDLIVLGNESNYNSESLRKKLFYLEN